MIVAEPESPAAAVCGAAANKDEARVTLAGVPDVPGTSLEIFSRIAERNITVDMIVQNVGAAGRADISFTVPRDELQVTLEAVEEARALLGDIGLSYDDDVSKVSVVGLGMARQTGVAQQMFRALADAGVNIQMITTSEIKISVLIQRPEAHQALRAVHQAFQLERPPATPAVSSKTPSGRHPDAVDIATRLQGINMEQLMISEVVLDDTQARVTIAGVPDRPGVAARVFNEVAAAGIFVDMIVQSFQGADGLASLSFTVPRTQLDTAVEVAERSRASCQFTQVTSSGRVAKLSVTGVGLRSHTDVAIRMFRALAALDVNVEMVNTSEVRVNVVVAAEHGSRGLTALKEAFADAMQ
jgi:aspartate kinase